MEGKRLKKCSTSTTDAVNKKPLQKLKRKKIQKKTSVKKEMKKLRISFKELTETVKELEENLPTSRGKLPVKKMKKLRISFKELTETVKQVQQSLPVKKKEEYGKNWMTICVKGFDASLPKDDIKTALTNHFGSCGGVIRDVFVPTVWETGASKGSAHISMTLEDENKALTLDGSLLGGRRLEVRMATFGYPNNRGCKTCPLVFMEGKVERFVATNNGRCLSLEVEHSMKKRFEQSMKKRCNNRTIDEEEGRTINEEEVEQSMKKTNNN